MFPGLRPPTRSNAPLARSPPTSHLSNFPTNRQADKLASWQAPAVQRGGGGEPPSVTWSVHHTPSNAPAPAEPTPAPSTRAGCLLSLLPRGTRARSPPPRRLPAPPHPSSPPDLTPSATRGTRAHPTSATATATPPSSRTPPPHNAAKRPNPIPLSYPGVNHGTPAEPPSVPAEPASSSPLYPGVNCRTPPVSAAVLPAHLRRLQHLSRLNPPHPVSTRPPCPGARRFLPHHHPRP